MPKLLLSAAAGRELELVVLAFPEPVEAAAVYARSQTYCLQWVHTR